MTALVVSWLTCSISWRGQRCSLTHSASDSVVTTSLTYLWGLRFKTGSCHIWLKGLHWTLEHYWKDRHRVFGSLTRQGFFLPHQAQGGPGLRNLRRSRNWKFSQLARLCLDPPPTSTLQGLGNDGNLLFPEVGRLRERLQIPMKTVELCPHITIKASLLEPSC